MKNKLLLLLLLPLLFSCEKETINNIDLHNDTDPNYVSDVIKESNRIDSIIGTYKVEYIGATGQNLLTGETIDTMITSGTFELKDPIEPFDRLEIGERIRFDEYYMYGGYYLSNIGDEWEYNFGYGVHQDLQTMEFNRIEISYFNTKRVFTIIDIGTDYMVISSSGLWEGDSDENTYTKFTVYLGKI
jgi:hypothetical protein